jgi:proline iminopeptidase
VEYADRPGAIKVPTLITVRDHDESDPSIAREMHARIPGSKLTVLPRSGHMTFVDQPGRFDETVEEFLNLPSR